MFVAYIIEMLQYTQSTKYLDEYMFNLEDTRYTQLYSSSVIHMTVNVKHCKLLQLHLFAVEIQHLIELPNK